MNAVHCIYRARFLQLKVWWHVVYYIQYIVPTFNAIDVIKLVN